MQRLILLPLTFCRNFESNHFKTFPFTSALPSFMDDLASCLPRKFSMNLLLFLSLLTDSHNHLLAEVVLGSWLLEQAFFCMSAPLQGGRYCIIMAYTGVTSHLQVLSPRLSHLGAIQVFIPSSLSLISSFPPAEDLGPLMTFLLTGSLLFQSTHE